MRSVGEAIRPAIAGAMAVRERWRSGVSYNPLSVRTVQDPYPPVCGPACPLASASQHAAQRMAVHAPGRCGCHSPRPRALRQRPAQGYVVAPSAGPAAPGGRVHPVLIDPPDHTRLKALVNKAFTQRAVSALEPHIRGSLGALLDRIRDPAAFDLMRAVARPLPVMAIAEMLGVPAEDRDRFGVWSALRARMLEPTITPRERAAGVEAGKAFDAWFRPIIKQRSAAPRDDIVSALVQAQDERGRLSERETLNMLRLLVIAGNESTTNLIGNGMLALLRNPD